LVNEELSDSENSDSGSEIDIKQKENDKVDSKD
jgi:hypothetical protein